MHETQYYASSNCTHSNKAYSQSDYNIPINTCNAVHTPNIPAGNVVAYTEYVGLTYVNVNPTRAPTMAPTQNDQVLFAAQQVSNSE